MGVGIGARICVKRVRSERPVRDGAEEEEGVDVPVAFGVEAEGAGVRVRMVRRREEGVSVM